MLTLMAFVSLESNMYRLLIILFSLFACAPQGQEVITSSPDSPAAKETQETVAPQVTEPATPITETNWRSHESLDEVRDLVKAVNEGQMTRDAKRFTEPCATEQALESILLKDTDGRIRMFESSAGVDVWRMVRHYYDESGQLRFVMSTYAHSSAESKYLSRLYLNADGSTLYEPALEKLSERDGPGDPLGINEYSMKTADAAAAEHTRLVTACDTSPQACCCRHSDPAGAGLTRFSRDQGTCDGSIYMSGCVDSGICDVAKLTDVEPPSGTLKLTLPSGVTATVTGNPERV